MVYALTCVESVLLRGWRPGLTAFGVFGESES